MDKIELTEEEFLAKIKEANLGDNLDKYTQRIGDKRTTEGINSYIKNQDKKDFSDKERLEAVEAELKNLKDTTAKENINTLIEAELEKQNLSKGLLKYISVTNNDPSEIEKSVTALRDDLLKIEQDRIDLRLKEGTPPPTGDKAGAGSLLENYIKNANEGKNNSPFEGKISKSEGD